jgi:hypothetical protein
MRMDTKFEARRREAGAGEWVGLGTGKLLAPFIGPEVARGGRGSLADAINGCCFGRKGKQRGG